MLNEVITQEMVRKSFYILSTQHYLFRSKLIIDENGDFYFEEIIIPDDDDN